LSCVNFRRAAGQRAVGHALGASRLERDSNGTTSPIVSPRPRRREGNVSGPARVQIAMTPFLQRFTNIRREEVAPVLVSTFFFFCILTALMVLRPARDALGMQRGMDTIRWLFIGTAVVTLLANPVFGLLVSRFRRLVFITATYSFFGASLLVFYGLLVLAPGAVGVTSGMVFYVWFSVFNLFVTMVFWAMMADRWSLEQSKRLFGVVAVGGTLGAIFGPWLASRLAEPLGTATLLPIAVGFLGLAVVAAWIVAWLQPEQPRMPVSDPDGDLDVDREAAGEAHPPAVDEREVIGGGIGISTALSAAFGTMGRVGPVGQAW
jgi:ATP:ADP antiporter, AAA family